MAEKKRGMPPTHPGQLLREEIMPTAKLTQERLAQELGVSRKAINEIVTERRGVSADMAHRLAKYFGTSPDVWLGLQGDSDLWEAWQANGKIYDAIKPLKQQRVA